MADDLRIGVDIGGTFTDAIAISRDGVATAKVPSSPSHPAEAVLAALDALDLKVTPARFLHGTTLVTNMLLERKGAPTGFLTTAGIRDVLHIGRHERPITYAIRQEIPQQHYPPVPRKWRITIPERISADGEVLISLDENAVRRAARKLAAEGVEAIAVGFLHSYRFPEHERRAERWIREEAPGLFVCTSHEVSPRFREYERFLTTAWNARVAPGAADYLSELASQIRARWPELRLTLMTSNGGLEEVDMLADAHRGDLRRTPIRLALSGPAAAGNAVSRAAQDLNLSQCVGLDVGGTSSDIVVIRDGRLREAPWEERRIGGYPLQIPMLDLHTIGAGGGSTVALDEYNAIHVGPQSAGAVPGPACYGRGGTLPTVTDAAAVVGRIPGDILLGGTLPIQARLAEKAFLENFGINRDELIRTCLDVLALAEANIAFGIRERTVARGIDPADLSLIAAGGAGPMLACGVADMLGLAEVVIPPRPGLLAAWGLLVAPERRETAGTVLRSLASISAEQALSLFLRAEDQLPSPMTSDARLYRSAALRYLGQGFEVEVPVDDPEDIPELERRFHTAHEREYGFAMPGSPVEWIELRVAREIPAESDIALPRQDNFGSVPEEANLWESTTNGTAKGQGAVLVPAKIFPRNRLGAGSYIEGPAIVLEQNATTYIPTGWTASVTHAGYMRIRKIR